jgi:UDP-N-acetylmuramate--alanine ligase
VDDYGHHPTEVAAVLRAARTVSEGEVWVIFQPHTAHRTRSLFDQFVNAFAGADHALLLPIYRPSGRDIESNVSTEDVVDGVRQRGHADVRYVESFANARKAILDGAHPGDLVLTMGAGDVTLLAGQLVEALSA